MKHIDDLIRETEKAFAGAVRLPHQAGAIAMNLFLLSTVCRLAKDPRVADLQEKFRQAIHSAPFEDLLANEVRYASRLARAPGLLIYEEMHKLFSLCDEVHALVALGYEPDEELAQRFEDDVRSRFAAQPKDAHLVAVANAEDWNRSLWWYAENLSPQET